MVNGCVSRMVMPPTWFTTLIGVLKMQCGGSHKALVWPWGISWGATR